jgi:hypothetical protein
VAQVFPRLTVEDNDTTVRVSICHEDLIVDWVDPYFSWSPHKFGIITSTGLIKATNRHKVLPISRELERKIALTSIGPHEVVVIDK